MCGCGCVKCEGEGEGEGAKESEEKLIAIYAGAARHARPRISVVLIHPRRYPRTTTRTPARPLDGPPGSCCTETTNDRCMSFDPPSLKSVAARRGDSIEEVPRGYNTMHCDPVLVRGFLVFCILLIGVGCTLPLTLLWPDFDELWKIEIDNGPAPSPEDGPPESANANRDPSHLPYEIGAIVGSYVLTVLILFTFLLTIGRRLRRASQASPSTLDMEILKPLDDTTENPWGPSPVTPVQATQVDWPESKHHYHTSVQSIETFDENVLEKDRARNELEMDRLYAAVAQHEAEREQSRQHSRQTSVTSADPPRSPLAQHPPELQHLRYGNVAARQSTTSSVSTGIPPVPHSPTEWPSRASTKSPRRLHKPSPIDLPASPRPASHGSSIVSFGRKKSTSSSVRDLKISSPIASPETEAHVAESFASVQLDSGQRFHFAPSVHSARSNGPSPAATPRTATFPVVPPPVIREQQNESLHGFNFGLPPPQERGPPTCPLPAVPYQQQQQRPLQHYPHWQPQVPQSQQYQQPSQQQQHQPPPPPTLSLQNPSPPASMRSGRFGLRVKPAPLALNGVTTGSTASSPQSTHGTGLPLRTAPLPLRDLRSPTGRPPSIIKATEVERPEKKRLQNLLSPGTAGGVPKTPYSPYMPMTPLTPMTPSRLVTREERKARRKEEGRRILTAEDAVPEESELWGDAY